MGLHDDREMSRLPPGDPGSTQTAGPISSLNEAWFHTLDRCVTDSPLSEVILPLMRNCFFWRGHARRFLTAEGSWRPASCRYCRLHQGRATVLTRRAFHSLN